MIQRIDGKVTPEMAIFIQLDELNGRIAELTRVVGAGQAEGRHFSQSHSITDVPTRLRFEAYSYTLYNDGDDTVYTSHQQDVDTGSVRAGLNKGDLDQVNHGVKRQVDIWVRCAPAGTATIRVRAMI